MITCIALLLGGDARALRLACKIARLYRLVNRAAKRGVPSELAPILRDLRSLKGSPVYEPTLSAIQTLIEIAAYKAGKRPDR